MSTNFLGGVTQATESSTLGVYPVPDPTALHQWFDDFDDYTAGEWTITETGTGTRAVGNLNNGVLVITNAAADDDVVGDVEQCGQDTELVRHLGAAEHHRIRPRRVLREARQHVHLRRDQVTGVVRQQLRHVVHRGLLAVDDTEPVGDERPVGPGELGQRRREGLALRVVLAGLARVEPDVLQQQHVTVGQPLGPGQRIRADDIPGLLIEVGPHAVRCESWRPVMEALERLVSDPVEVQ